VKGKAKAKEDTELGEQPDGRVLKLLPDHLAPDLDSEYAPAAPLPRRPPESARSPRRRHQSGPHL
jgi:hypothetical protein